MKGDDDDADALGSASAYEMFPVLHPAVGAGLIVELTTDGTDGADGADGADEENSICVIRVIRGQKKRR